MYCSFPLMAFVAEHIKSVLPPNVSKLNHPDRKASLEAEITKQMSLSQSNPKALSGLAAAQC
jgi:hypothetical protein